MILRMTTYKIGHIDLECRCGKLFIPLFHKIKIRSNNMNTKNKKKKISFTYDKCELYGPRIKSKHIQTSCGLANWRQYIRTYAFVGKHTSTCMYACSECVQILENRFLFHSYFKCSKTSKQPIGCIRSPIGLHLTPILRLETNETNENRFQCKSKFHACWPSSISADASTDVAIERFPLFISMKLINKQ